MRGPMSRAILASALFASTAWGDCIVQSPGDFQEIQVTNARSRVVSGCMILAGTPGRLQRVAANGRTAVVVWLPVACAAHQPAAMQEAAAPITELVYSASD